MKTITMSIFLLFCLTLFTNCEKDEVTTREVPEADQWLIFGTFHGFCVGDCVHLYKIQNGKLFADDGLERFTTNYFEQSFDFQIEELPTEKYELVKGLETGFPQILWEQEEQVFGMPDAHDQGGIIVELSRQGETKRWIMDTVEERLPEYLQDYARKINGLMQDLE